MKRSVTNLMTKHHDILGNLFNSFEKKKDFSLFEKFKWEVEKHFFTEEKAVFLYSRNGSMSNIIPDLLIQHNKILDMMKHEITDIAEFKRLLIKHKEFEEDTFYPRLDEELDEHQKKLIFERIEQIK